MVSGPFKKALTRALTKGRDFEKKANELIGLVDDIDDKQLEKSLLELQDLALSVVQGIRTAKKRGKELKKLPGPGDSMADAFMMVDNIDKVRALDYNELARIMVEMDEDIMALGLKELSTYPNGGEQIATLRRALAKFDEWGE